MAAAPTNPTIPAEHRRCTPEELERARKSTTEHLQHPSDDIAKARRHATGGVRHALDSALERLREVSGELRQRAEDHAAEWQDALEQASDKVRREMDRDAIRAQRAPEALKELSGELHMRETELGRPRTGEASYGR
jgi:hypothetical protein